jgi:octaprenyl-diphosphate synthase
MNLKIYNPQDFPTYLPKLNALYDELLASGKGFRSKLVAKVSGALELKAQTQHLLSQTVEFIHNASLLHDDLVDRSATRRGKTAAWLKYSPEYAVLAGDYLLARVMVNLSGFGNIQLVHYTATAISELLEGEWLQDSLVGDFEVSMSDLDRVHNLKTASLFKWCLRAPFLANNQTDPELHQIVDEMGTLLGQLFQRSDDLLDFDVRNTEGKAPLGDLRSGYLNSFAAFATQDMDVSERKKLKNCQGLVDFHRALGGESSFLKKVELFDQVNRNLIERYLAQCKALGQKLSVEQRKLENELAPLGDLLYWRNGKSS